MISARCFHVSATAGGQGVADGSATRPWPSLAAARDGLREIRRREGLSVPVRVLVAPGVYRLEQPLCFAPEDGGTASCPVTWAGEGGRPLISGGRAIGDWREGTINGRPCWQSTLAEVAAGRWWFTQLFVNGRRRLRARLPKHGFFRFAGVPEAEAKRDTGGHFHGAMSAHFAAGQVEAFRNLADIEVVVPDHWYENHLRIAGIDLPTRTIHFATRGYSRFSRDETGLHTRFRLDHVAEACTEPGDWYLDRASGTLSYIPLPGERRESTLVEAPAVERLLDLQGDPLDPARRVRHLRFEFLDFRHADWELPRDNAGSLQSAFQVPAAVRLVGAEQCALYGCRVSQVAGWAVELLRGCHGNRVVACALHDLGGGGVKIGHEGGLPRQWVDGNHGAFRGLDAEALGWGPCREEAGGRLAGRDRGESSATTVSDCSIHDGGLIFHSAIGVWIGDASRNRVVHNHIWNFSYSGISCGWTWGYAPAFTYDNRIDNNRIHGIGHGVLSDMGAIYTLGRQAGSSICGNFISDVHSYGYGGWGIYPDEGSSWLTIEDNVVCGTKCGGFHQHYGRDNLVRHNLFVEAIENQVQISRREIVRSAIFVGNLVQGAGSGSLWQGAGSAAADIERNVYASDAGRPARFGGGEWAAWQAAGRDRRGALAEAVLLDAGGAAPVVANPAILKAAGLVPRRLAAVVGQAGPRWRETLPSSLDAVPLEPEVCRPIIEPLLWPWEAEWPLAGSSHRPWGKLPPTTAVLPGMAQAVSLTVENRGDAPACGRYRLRVVPGAAARLLGERELAVDLRPGGRTALDATLMATGKVKAFRLEAVGRGDGLVDTCLLFTVSGKLALPRLASVPAAAELAARLALLPARAVDGNGQPLAASVRLAVAGGFLLVRVDAEDAAPVRGPQLWDGSSVELFVASRVGAPPCQLIVAAPLPTAAAEARLATQAGLVAVPEVELSGLGGVHRWTLAAAVPLTLLGIEPAADSLAVDLVVNATRSGESAPCRVHLASEFNPHGDSSCYLLATIQAEG